MAGPAGAGPSTAASRPRSLYGAFDRFPSAKGAATHIAHAAGVLFDTYAGGHLFVLGDETLPRVQQVHREAGPVTVFRSRWPHPSELARTQQHARALAAHLARHRHTLELVHVRDPWSAVPATAHPERPWRTVFEVNGLPSVEMPVRYENVSAGTLDRVRALEDHALARADLFVTPSTVTRTLLQTRGIPAERIVWVPNGADVPDVQPERPPDAPARYVLYFGAMQPWQGVGDAMRAMTRLTDLHVKLVLVSSVREKKCRSLARLARRLGIADQVVWRYELPRVEVARWVAHAVATLAPLTRSPRNVVQGCCPLKVLESMAQGTPVVASDLPVVRDLMEHQVHGWLVPAERPAAMARGIRVLLDHPSLAHTLGMAGQQRIRDHFTWERATKALTMAYRRVEALPRQADPSEGERRERSASPTDLGTAQ